MILCCNKNKSIGLVIFVCLFFSGSLLLAKSGPRIEFKEKSWNIGKTKQGKIHTHVFVFRNIGDSPLTIKKVRTTCGCTAALVSKKKLDPGERGEIKVTFNTKGYEGNVAKYIYVESNDPNQPQIQLMVSAEIDVPPRPIISLDHYSLDTGLILEEEKIQARTKVKNRGELELEVIFSHNNALFFNKGKKISFPIRIASGKEVEIEIEIPLRKKKGLIREYILLKSNDPRRPTLSLYISGYIITKKQLKELFIRYKKILD